MFSAMSAKDSRTNEHFSTNAWCVLGSLFLLMQCVSSFSDICPLCTIEAF